MNRKLLALLAFATAAFLPGLPWGLPSSERGERVLPAAQRTPELLASMSAARAAIYERSGGNPSVELGEKAAQGKPLYEPAWQVPGERLLLSYSSFLVRSSDADEQRSLAALAQINPLKLKFNPHYFVYGSLYLYPLGAWLGAAHVAHLVRLTSDITYYYKDPDAMRRIFLAGRLLSALAAIVLVLVVYRIAEDVCGPDAAWEAALLVLLVPVLLAQARLMKPHAPAAILALLSLRRASRLVDGDAWEDYLWACVWGGLAMSMNLAYFLIPVAGVATGHFMRAWRAGGPGALLRSLGDPKPWMAGLVLAGIYLAINPWVLVSWKEFHAEVSGYALKREYSVVFSPMQLVDFWYYPVRAGLGTPLWIAFLASMVVLAWRGGRRDWFYLLQILIVTTYYSFQSGAWAVRPEIARYVLPLLVLAGVMTVRAARLLAPALSFVVAIAAAAPAACAWWNYVRDTPTGSNAAQAGRWIDENVPAGTGIAIVEPMPHLYAEPPFRFADHPLFSLAARDGQALPPYAVTAFNYATLPEADGRPIEESFAKLGYRPAAEFRDGCRNTLSTADMPFVVYRLEAHGH